MADSTLAGLTGITTSAITGAELLYTDDGSSDLKMTWRQVNNLVPNSVSAAYTTLITDANRAILHPAADTTARTWNIAAEASVNYDVGTTITFINQHSAGALTIHINSDTMRIAGAGTTGDRTLAADGIATAVKIASANWIISGVGLT